MSKTSNEQLKQQLAEESLSLLANLVTDKFSHEAQHLQLAEIFIYYLTTQPDGVSLLSSELHAINVVWHNCDMLLRTGAETERRLSAAGMVA